MRSERPLSLLITFGLFTRIRSRTCSERFFSKVLRKKSVLLFFFQENDPPHEFCFAIIHSKYQKINKVLRDHGLGLPPGFSSACASSISFLSKLNKLTWTSLQCFRYAYCPQRNKNVTSLSLFIIEQSLLPPLAYFTHSQLEPAEKWTWDGSVSR